MLSLGQLDNPNAPQYTPIIGKWAAADGTYGVEWQWNLYNKSYAPRPQWFSYYICDFEQNLGAGSNWQPGTMQVGEWHYATGTAWYTSATAGTEKIFVDAVYNGASATWDWPQGGADYPINYQNGTGPIRIGNYTGSYSRCFKGDLAEWRVSNVVRSDAWIKATSSSNQDDIVTYAPDETVITYNADFIVAASTDDCTVYWNGTAWTLSTTSGNGYLGSVAAGTVDYAGQGLRLTPVDAGDKIPKDANISTAYITFQCKETTSTTGVNGTFTGGLEPSGATFSNIANYQGRRGTVVGGANNNYITTAHVHWDSMATQTANTDYQSPELKTVVQEQVNQATWPADGTGNLFIMYFDDHDNRSTAGSYRNEKSWNTSTTACARLHVEWTETESNTPPTVSTSAATSVTATTATLNGNLADLGTAASIAVSFEYGTSIAYGSTATVDASPLGSTGDFSSNISSLSKGTTYHFRAKAVGDGTVYGDDVTLLTIPDAPSNVVATDGTHNDKVTITWDAMTGATDYQVYRDGAALGWLGDVQTYDDVGADAPVITAGNAVATDGTSTANVGLSLAGTSVVNGTTHTYKVVAKNASGNSADSSTNTGYRGHGVLTYQWQKSAADADAAYSNIVGATSSTYSDTAAPAPTITAGTATASDGTSENFVSLSIAGESTTAGAGRYYKCIINADGAVQVISGSNRGYRGVGALSYQWQRSAVDADAAYSDILGAVVDIYNDTGAPANGDGRYYKCVLDADGATQQATAGERGYRAVPAAPSTLSDGGIAQILIESLLPLIIAVGVVMLALSAYGSSDGEGMNSLQIIFIGVVTYVIINMVIKIAFTLW